MLPAANCGACGYPGCRGFADAVCKASDLSNLNCPVGGNTTMTNIANEMGFAAVAMEPTIAVLRCNGSLQKAPPKVNYEGAKSCLSAHSIFAGESGCSYGCLGLSDCCKVCTFDALHMDKTTGLPVVDEQKCTSCGACVKICPRKLFEIRPKGNNSQRVYVACMNKEKGVAAKKNCEVACIGCQKCTKVYDHGGEIKIENFCAYFGHKVDSTTHGNALVACCPTGAIVGKNIETQQPTENK
jgi:Na+-translocating ferredoxin:NAD+ oxidoreductase RNF subunit RnfB